VQDITPELQSKLQLKDTKGALVADVAKGGPAHKAGIQRGDVIVSFDGKEIRESHALSFIVASTPVGQKVKVEFVRKGKKSDVKVEIGELKDETQESEQATGETPALGMTVQEITPELADEYGLPQKTGIIVAQVEEDSPAAEAGINPADIILEVDQVPMTTVQQFEKKIRSYKAGDTILFLIKREAGALYVTLKIEK